MNARHLIAALAAAALIACGGGEKKAGGGGASGGSKDTLVIAFDGSPTNLDPRLGVDSYSGRVWDIAGGGLIKLTPTGDFTGDVAASWETPDDKTIIFKLKPGAKFQDGKPITSKDFKYTFESMMDPAFTTPKKSGYASVAAFEAPDDQTFIVRLKEPNAGIFDNFPYMLIPQGADPKVFARTPILAGAYQIKEFRTDERITMDAFDGWVNGKPKIPHISIRIVPDATTRVLEMQRGSINFAVNSIPLEQVPAFQKNSDFKVVTSHGGPYQYLAFNLKDPIFARKEVRQAIAHAIDRERIVRDLLRGFGKVTNTMFPEGHWARAENLPNFEYSPEKAKQLLDKAGHRDPDGDGPRTRFKFTFRTSTDAEMNQQAEMMQQMLRQVGVEMEIRSSEFGTFMDDVTNGRFQLFSLRRNGISDPDFYYTIFHSKSLAPNGQNRGWYVNPKIDQLIDQGRSTFDRAKRKQTYEEIQKTVAEELPYISLYHRDNIAIMRSNIDGFTMYPNGFLLSIPQMTIR